MHRYEISRTEAAEEALRAALLSHASSADKSKTPSLQSIQQSALVNFRFSEEKKVIASLDADQEEHVTPLSVLAARRHARSQSEVAHLTSVGKRLASDLEASRATNASLRKEIVILKQSLEEEKARSRDHLKKRAIAVSDAKSASAQVQRLGDRKRSLEEAHALLQKSFEELRGKHDALVSRVREEAEAAEERRKKKWTLKKFVRLLKKRL